MDRKLLILQNFVVMVPTGKYDSGPHEGENKPDSRVQYSKGMVVDEANVPENQSADDWIAKELAEAAE
jgi:hypothetical protein